jgi:uncharacterized cupin superfamily protein
MSGVRVLSVLDAPVQPDPLQPSQILEGDPQTSDHQVAVSADGRAISGVWTCTPGVFRDVEVDETFVVISGRATIVPEGGEPIDVGPGDLCVLTAGTRTVWTVYEELVKGYQLYLDVADPA